MSDRWVVGRLIPRSIHGHKKKERENDDNSLIFSMRGRLHLSMWLLPDSSTRIWWEHSKFAKIPWYYPCYLLLLLVTLWKACSDDRECPSKYQVFFTTIVVFSIFCLSRFRQLGSTCGRSAKAMWQSSSGTSVDNQGGWCLFLCLFVCLITVVVEPMTESSSNRRKLSDSGRCGNDTVGGWTLLSTWSTQLTKIRLRLTTSPCWP